MSSFKFPDSCHENFPTEFIKYIVTSGSNEHHGDFGELFEKFREWFTTVGGLKDSLYICASRVDKETLGYFWTLYTMNCKKRGLKPETGKRKNFGKSERDLYNQEKNFVWVDPEFKETELLKFISMGNLMKNYPKFIPNSAFENKK